MLTMSVTDERAGDRTLLGRVYDRLRKRSLRAIDTKEGYARMTGSEDKAEGWFDWDDFDHRAYLLGVRHALNAVKEEG